MEIKIGDWKIRNFSQHDADALVRYANNRNVWINLRDSFPYPFQLSDAKNFLSKVAQQNPRTVFAIANDKEAIGSIGLMPGEDVHRFTAEKRQTDIRTSLRSIEI